MLVFFKTSDFYKFFVIEFDKKQPMPLATENQKFLNKKNTAWGYPLLTLFFVFIIIFMSAWVSEDAFITFRVVENLHQSIGPNFNAGYRVQAYTHPLWFFFLSFGYIFSDELFLLSILLNLFLSLTVLVVFCLKIAPAPQSAALGLLTLSLSKAFVDYSTSGLENSLSHLIAAIFFAAVISDKRVDKKFTTLSLLACAAALNRLDTLLLFLPTLLLNFKKTKFKKGAWSIIICFLPLIIWEIFSILYYGFPFPNTAYAKLGAGIPRFDLVSQGVSYFIDGFQRDLLTSIVIFLGIGLSFFSRQRSLFPISIGILLYLIYILWIGGDFMSGRFFSTPFLFAVFCVVNILDVSKVRNISIAIALVTVIAFLVPSPTLLAALRYDNAGDGQINNHGIADERGHWEEHFGLYRKGKIRFTFDNEQERPEYTNRQIAVFGNIGYYGYKAGYKVHFIDPPALADPLLARIPMKRNPDWRVGHFDRAVPDGYVKSIRTGTNFIKDKKLALFYDKLDLIIRGNIFDPLRLKTIVLMNIGVYDKFIDKDFYRNHP